MPTWRSSVIRGTIMSCFKRHSRAHILPNWGFKISRYKSLDDFVWTPPASFNCKHSAIILVVAGKRREREFGGLCMLRCSRKDRPKHFCFLFDIGFAGASTVQSK
uniref:Uncharacterized protein n=1 Tax=Rhizophora mucronata TaxID=61149 RepID=A0A2P2QBH6_RHIMU